MSVKIKNNLVNYNPKQRFNQIERIPTQLPELEEQEEEEDFSSLGSFSDSVRDPALINNNTQQQPQLPQNDNTSKQEISWGSLVIAGVLGCVLGSNLEKIQMANNNTQKTILFKQ